jgi:hypothetical protein
MNMIGHDHKILEAIFNAIIVTQDIFNDFPQIGPGQQTFAVIFIQPLFPSVRKQPIVFLLGFRVPRFGMLFQP